MVGGLTSQGPHLGFMLIPVVARGDDGGLDLVFDMFERLNSVLLGRVWWGELKLVYSG